MAWKHEERENLTIIARILGHNLKCNPAAYCEREVAEVLFLALELGIVVPVKVKNEPD